MKIGALLVDCGHTREEFRVEVDESLVRRGVGRFDTSNLLQSRVGGRARDSEENGRGAIEQLAGLFHGNDRVVEGRSGGVVGNGLHLRLLPRDAGLDGGLKVVVLYFVEGRSLEGKRAGRIKRIIWAEGGGGCEG